MLISVFIVYILYRLTSYIWVYKASANTYGINYNILPKINKEMNLNISGSKNVVILW